MSENRGIKITLAISEILEELDRAENIHPNWPDDPIHQVAVMAEEAGESIQAAIDVVYKGRGPHELRRELVQTGAMVLRVLLNMKGAA